MPHIIEICGPKITDRLYPDIVVLGGVMVKVIAIGPKVRGFNPAKGDGY
jgi:hypothetical protein